MKTLSLRQPWAWAILHAGKRIENRGWNTHYRGDFLIHASLANSAKEHLEAVKWMVSRGFARSSLVPLETMEAVFLPLADRAGAFAELPEVPPMHELPRGGIVGGSRLVDVLRPSVDGKPRAPWHIPTEYGLVLASAEELPFRPLKGLQKFFESDSPGRRVAP